MKIESICDRHNFLIATIITELDEIPSGHSFPTTNEAELQVGLFRHPATHQIKRHYHPEFKRELKYTSEILLILDGLLQVDIYDEKLELLATRELPPNSLAILSGGGHGFKVLKECRIVEVKQGPYAGEYDKVLF